MSDAIEKRSMSLHGHRTSVALEPDFWDVIDKAALAAGQSLAGFIMQIDDERIKARYPGGLASYLRVWSVRRLQQAR